MTDVEYRLLVVESGAAFGDRTVIGLVHSDGKHVRHVFHRFDALLARIESDLSGQH